MQHLDDLIPQLVGIARLGDSKRMFKPRQFFRFFRTARNIHLSLRPSLDPCNLGMVFRPNNHNGRIARLDYAFVDTSYKRTGKIEHVKTAFPDLVVNRLGYTMRPDYDNRALVTGNRVQVLGYANPFFFEIGNNVFIMDQFAIRIDMIEFSNSFVYCIARAGYSESKSGIFRYYYA